MAGLTFPPFCPLPLTESFVLNLYERLISLSNAPRNSSNVHISGIETVSAIRKCDCKECNPVPTSSLPITPRRQKRNRHEEGKDGVNIHLGG